MTRTDKVAMRKVARAIGALGPASATQRHNAALCDSGCQFKAAAHRRAAKKLGVWLN